MKRRWPIFAEFSPHELRQLYALLGVTNWQELQEAPIVLSADLEHYRQARGLPGI